MSEPTLRDQIAVLTVMDDSDTADGWNGAIERVLRLLDAQPAPDAVAEAWQAMDTAPTDGTKFVATNGRLTFTTYALKYYEKFPHEEGGPIYKTRWSAEDGSSVWPWEPTRWMPLPVAKGNAAMTHHTQAPERICTWDNETYEDGEIRVRGWTISYPAGHPREYTLSTVAAAQTAAAWLAGRDAAAGLNDLQISDYVYDHGSTDPSTGMVEFPGDGEEWVGEREELSDAIRALTPPADASAALDALIAERVPPQVTAQELFDAFRDSEDIAPSGTWVSGEPEGAIIDGEVNMQALADWFNARAAERGK